jgi:type IV secretory pathway VirB2 component (pilin)
MVYRWRRAVGALVLPLLWVALPGRALADPGGPGTAVIQAFLANVAHWIQVIASTVAVCTVAYGGLRHAAAHTAHAQAEAWRVIAAGVAGLVVALLAPTIVSIVQGLIPS